MKKNGQFHSGQLVKCFGTLLVCLLLFGVKTASAAETVSINGYGVGFLRHENELHFLVRESSRLICYQITPEHTLTRCTHGCAGKDIQVTMLTPDNETYSIINQAGNYGVYRWTPNEETVWQYVAAWPRNDSAETNALCVQGVYLCNGQAVFEFATEDHESWTVTSFDLSSGEERQLTTLNQFSVQPYVCPDGTLVVPVSSTGTIRFQSIGSRTGTVTNLMESSSSSIGQLYGIMSQGEKECYALTNAALYTVDEEGTPSLVNYTPSHGYAEQVQLALCPEGDRLAFCCSANDDMSEQQLFFIPLDRQETDVLAIVDAGRYLQSYYHSPSLSLLLEAQHPGTIVTYLDHPSTLSEIAESMVMGNTDYDLLVMLSDMGLRQILDKGYYTDLSDVEAVAELVGSMYPVWQQQLMRNGQVAGLAFWTEDYSAIGYNRVLWEEMNLGALPQTWDELLDCVERWEAEGLLEDIKLFSYRNMTMSKLVYQLLKEQIVRCGMRGESIHYQDETLTHLLERLLSLKEVLERNFAMQPQNEDSYLFRLEYDTCPPQGDNSFMRDYRLLPLTLAEGDAWGRLVTYYVIILNPRSEHRELAEDYLTLAAQQMSARKRVIFVDEMSEGVEMEAYQQNIASIMEELETSRVKLDEAIAQADKQELLRWKENVELLEESLLEFEQMRWKVRPEDAAMVRNSMDALIVSEDNGLLLLSNAENYVKAFVEGARSAEDLVRRLDEIQNMWEMENQ